MFDIADYCTEAWEREYLDMLEYFNEMYSMDKETIVHDLIEEEEEMPF